MVKQDFIKTMNVIAGSYRDDRYIAENVLGAWYKFFGKFDADVFSSMADEWIRHNAKSPQISDLISACNAKQYEVDKARQASAEDGSEKEIDSMTDKEFAEWIEKGRKANV